MHLCAGFEPLYWSKGQLNNNSSHAVRQYFLDEMSAGYVMLNKYVYLGIHF